MIYWVLVMTFVLNGQVHTLEAEQMAWLTCNLAASSAEKKTIRVDGQLVQVTEAHCDKRLKPNDGPDPR